MNDLIQNPAHYTEGRMIQPIHVIEHWSLCHHLACVVKYIARAGRKNPILEDLRKAEWYLMRELTRYQNNFNRCHLRLVNLAELVPTAVLEDWELSPHLGNALVALRLAKLGNVRIEELRTALTELQKEIALHEPNFSKGALECKII